MFFFLCVCVKERERVCVCERERERATGGIDPAIRTARSSGTSYGHRRCRVLTSGSEGTVEGSWWDYGGKGGGIK